MICVSEKIKNSFVAQGINHSKCIVIHNGIDTSITPTISPDIIKQELGIKEDEFLIGTVGSLVKRKRFNDLIKAVAFLKGQGSGVKDQKIKCIIIGEGPEKKSLEREIYRNRLDNTVLLTGFKSDAISYINAMDVFVLPSEREGFPRVILEAMLMGKPVIASRIAGPAELVIKGKTGFLFQTGNIEELAECISSLLSSPNLRREMGEAGKKRVIENFSIEKYVNQVSSVIKEVVG
jgi:glycosyltransferase involved in cell wall biosynthesis